MKIRSVILAVVILVSLDQIIKYVIQSSFLDTRFDIVPGLLEFRPTYNYDYSYVNNLFGANVGFVPHLILFIFILLLLVFMFAYLRTRLKSKVTDFLFIFGISGALCAIISTSFWQGVLDYIYLVPLFVFDLKDLYMNAFTILCMVFAVKYHKEKDLFNGKNILDYIKSLFVRNEK